MRRFLPIVMFAVLAFSVGKASAGEFCVHKIFSCSKYPPPPKQHFKATKTDCFGAKFMKVVLHKDCHGICIGQCLGKIGHGGSCDKCCQECCQDCCNDCCQQ